MKTRILLAAVSLVGFAGAAVAATDTISASDQKIANKTVTASDVIGSVAVKAGDNKGVVVPLADDVKPGSKLILMLHEESNADSKFDDKDKPVMVNGKPVMQVISVQ